MHTYTRPPPSPQAVSLDRAVKHWRGLLRGLASAMHSLLFVRGRWPALKAALVEFASQNHHSIVRSAMHLQLIKPLPPPPPPEAAAASAAKVLNGGAKAGKKLAAGVPPWCPGQQMVCREFGLSLAAVPSREAALFLEQAAIAVRRRGAHKLLPHSRPARHEHTILHACQAVSAPCLLLVYAGRPLVVGLPTRPQSMPC